MMDRYETHLAAREISGFVDSLSNWYVPEPGPLLGGERLERGQGRRLLTLYECP